MFEILEKKKKNISADIFKLSFFLLEKFIESNSTLLSIYI